MDIQSLQAFLAVVDAGSFSAAAQRLHLTQPAVTKRVQVLEAQLGTPLFDRFQRKILLTEAGALLLPNARLVIQQIGQTETAIRNLSGQIGGTLALATSHHIGLHRLPSVLKSFSRAYPEVNLELSFMESDRAYEAVLAGTVEMAFVTLSPDQAVPFSSTPIWHDPLVFVASPNHPLADNYHPTLSHLSPYAAILPEQSTHTYRIVQQLFLADQAPLQATMPTNYLETIKMMVSVGMGWSVLPETMVDTSLKRLEVQTPQLSRQLGAIVHSNRIMSNAARAILDEAKRSASVEP